MGRVALGHGASGPVGLCGQLPAQAVWSARSASVPLSKGTGCPLVVTHFEVTSEIARRGQVAGPRCWTLARPRQAPLPPGQGPPPRAAGPHLAARPPARCTCPCRPAATGCSSASSPPSPAPCTAASAPGGRAARARARCSAASGSRRPGCSSSPRGPCRTSGIRHRSCGRATV